MAVFYFMSLTLSATPIPAIHKRNFWHLYFDIGWYGVLSGSLLVFASVYLTRVGATTAQLGWFTGIPALVALGLALPVGWWLRDKQMDRVVFWSAIVFRLFYVLWLPLPLIMPASSQINLVLLFTLAMSIPGTVLSIGFNAMFANVVPPEWRSHVIGVRQAVLALTSITASLLAGYILESFSFTTGYQIVFTIGAIAAGMSTVHLWFVRQKMPASPRVQSSTTDPASPGAISTMPQSRPIFGERFLTRRQQRGIPRFEILRGTYGRVLLVIVFFQFSLQLPNPLYNPYWVIDLNYNDQLLSYGTALFYIGQFIGALQLSRLSKRFGDRFVFAASGIAVGMYPFLTALFPQTIMFLIASTIGGLAWGVAGGVMLAYVLRAVPANETPRYLAWYSLLTNLAVLTGSLVGPMLANWLGLQMGLAMGGVLRFLSGALIWLYRPKKALFA
jgi:MFS family permease